MLEKICPTCQGKRLKGEYLSVLVDGKSIDDTVNLDLGKFVNFLGEIKNSKMDDSKKEIAKVTNKEKTKGGIENALIGADIFIGVSKPNLITAKMVKTMAKNSIVFAMSNPNPEIMPEEAKKGGARVIATGRSDYPNQINNVLVFPGIFKGALEARAKQITDEMKLAAAISLSKLVKKPTATQIIPRVFDKNIAKVIASAVKRYAHK